MEAAFHSRDLIPLYNGLGAKFNRCISGLMVRDSALGSNDSGLFPGRERYELRFQFFKSSNEEIMGKEQKEEVLW